ncbi:Serine carboxypeptidase-like 51 [Linum perenne]
MAKFWTLTSSLLLVAVLAAVSSSSAARITSKTKGDGSEAWGYVKVRPKAHMFWWLYKSPFRVEDPAKPWPTILWLQGGPGASGVAIGNFQEVGPLDTTLSPRNSTWLQMADLLFVDSPVGTGYSFVEEGGSMVKTDVEAGEDLTVLLKEIFNKNEELQKRPLYIVAESYGGKIAATLGLSALKAIEAGTLKMKLGGIALGDSWISPEDFVLSWGPLLGSVSRLDTNGVQLVNRLAEGIKKQIGEEKYIEATDSWSNLEGVVSENSNNVDFYNFMLDSGMDPVSMTAAELMLGTTRRSYSRYLSSTTTAAIAGGEVGDGVDIETLMNGVIKKKLGIIPQSIKWGEQSGSVFSNMAADFMKPRINEVDQLLSKGINVTIYNGQLDIICATLGTEAWVQKLKWKEVSNFTGSKRKALYCGGGEGGGGSTKAFVKTYKNLHFYWILGAGHFIPVDQPCIALNMIREITHSPAAPVLRVAALRR